LSWRDPANGKIKELHVITIWCNYHSMTLRVHEFWNSKSLRSAVHCDATRLVTTCRLLGPNILAHGAKRWDTLAKRFKTSHES
jgi:hypothetical protein